MVSHRCEITVSEPLVPFKETVISTDASWAPGTPESVLLLPPPWRDTVGLKQSRHGYYRFVTNSRRLAIGVRCFRLPQKTCALLDSDATTCGRVLAGAIELCDTAHVRGSALRSVEDIPCTAEMPLEALRSMWEKVAASLSTTDEDEPIDSCLRTPLPADPGSDHFELFRRIVSIGPYGAGPNMLLMSPKFSIDIVSDLVTGVSDDNEPPKDDDEITVDQIVLDDVKTLVSVSMTQHPDVFFRIWARLKGALVAGFQMTAASGPLMAEALYGVGFAVESIEISRHFTGLSTEELCSLGADCATIPNEEGHATEPVLSLGHMISDVKDALRVSMLSTPLRVVEPLYKCSIQCDQMQLGNLYPVLSRRRGEVIEEDIIEGTSLFVLTVILPVADSFGFSQELLKKTSGSGTAPQLVFSHWRVIDMNPFWKPTTAEELEDLGESTVEPNLPRIFIDKVRKRKGMVVEEKIVVSAEKQRNLKTNK